jgi:hypothetical protein
MTNVAVQVNEEKVGFTQYMELGLLFIHKEVMNCILPPYDTKK